MTGPGSFQREKNGRVLDLRIIGQFSPFFRSSSRLFPGSIHVVRRLGIPSWTLLWVFSVSCNAKEMTGIGMGGDGEKGSMLLI